MTTGVARSLYFRLANEVSAQILTDVSTGSGQVAGFFLFQARDGLEPGFYVAVVPLGDQVAFETRQRELITFVNREGTVDSFLARLGSADVTRLFRSFVTQLSFAAQVTAALRDLLKTDAYAARVATPD